MIRNVVWMSVIAVVLGVVSIMSGVLEYNDLTLGTGLAAIAAAVLATRER
jgi:hypothetical protein